MKNTILFILFTICTSINSNAQVYRIIAESNNTTTIDRVEKILILEPLIQHKVPIMVNTIKSSVEEKIDSHFDYRFFNADEYKTIFENNTLINLNDIAEAEAGYDAILVIEYVLVESIVSYSTPADERSNYSRINMSLFNKRGELIAKSSRNAISADSYGLIKNPIKGIRTASRKAMRSIMSKLAIYNKTLLKA